MSEYRVAAMIADGFEETEAIGVIDLLKRVDIDVVMISIEKEKIVRGAHNIYINCDEIYDDISLEDFHMIFLPGGMPGTDNLNKNERLKKEIFEFFSLGKKIAAICAAPSILGDMGILKGKKATCFPGFEKRLKGADIINEKVVRDGNITTSKGLGTAIDLGLDIVEQVMGKEISKELGSIIQYK